MGISALLLTPCSLEMNGKLHWRFTGDYLDTGKVIIDSNDIKRRANGGFFMRHLCINIVYKGVFPLQFHKTVFFINIDSQFIKISPQNLGLVLRTLLKTSEIK